MHGPCVGRISVLPHLSLLPAHLTIITLPTIFVCKDLFLFLGPCAASVTRMKKSYTRNVRICSSLLSYRSCLGSLVAHRPVNVITWMVVRREGRTILSFPKSWIGRGLLLKLLAGFMSEGLEDNNSPLHQRRHSLSIERPSFK